MSTDIFYGKIRSYTNPTVSCMRKQCIPASPFFWEGSGYEANKVQLNVYTPFPQLCASATLLSLILSDWKFYMRVISLYYVYKESQSYLVCFL